MWVDREPHMSVAEHQLRLVLTAACWLAAHLDGAMPITVIVVDEAELSLAQDLLPTVHASGKGAVAVQLLETHVREAWADGACCTLQPPMSLASTKLPGTASPDDPAHYPH